MELVGYKIHVYYNVYNFQYFFILQVQTFFNTVEFPVLFSSCNHMPHTHTYIYIYIYVKVKQSRYRPGVVQRVPGR
jgi:hypothetical protein